jgi:hypothetical protein
MVYIYRVGRKSLDKNIWDLNAFLSSDLWCTLYSFHEDHSVPSEVIVTDGRTGSDTKVIPLGLRPFRKWDTLKCFVGQSAVMTSGCLKWITFCSLLVSAPGLHCWTFGRYLFRVLCFSSSGPPLYSARSAMRGLNEIISKWNYFKIQS